MRPLGRKGKVYVDRKITIYCDRHYEIKHFVLFHNHPKAIAKALASRIA